MISLAVMTAFSVLVTLRFDKTPLNRDNLLNKSTDSEPDYHYDLNLIIYSKELEWIKIEREAISSLL